MNDRRAARRHDQAAIRGAREGRDGALDLAGIAHVDRAHLHAERRRHGLDSRRTGRSRRRCRIAKDRRARHARRDLLEQLQPFAAQAVFERMKPVALPPGRARLSTKPAPTGSVTITNTIGTVRVACSNGRDVPRQLARMTSGASATNSAAYLRMGRHRPRPSGSRSARCGRRSSPIAAAPAGTPRGGPALPDRPRPRMQHADAPHPLAPAARAPRAATPPPRRRAA